MRRTQGMTPSDLAALGHLPKKGKDIFPQQAKGAYPFITDTLPFVMHVQFRLSKYARQSRASWAIWFFSSSTSSNRRSGR